MLAKRMGLPIKDFVAASNANDVVPEYLQTGEYKPRPSVRTVANAMDVGAPSNFERMMWLCGSQYDAMVAEMKGYSCSDQQIKDAVSEIYNNYGYISDPHSAVGYLATKHYDNVGFWLSTAHAAKFCEITQQAMNVVPELPSGLALAMGKHRVFTKVSSESDELKEILLNYNN